MRWNMNRGCDLAGQAVTDLFRAASGRTIFLDHPLQRRFQDVQAALAHAYLLPDQAARAVGGLNARRNQARDDCIVNSMNDQERASVDLRSKESNS
jgi:hypothetical protein